MRENIANIKNDRLTICVLLVIFIITEIIDFLLDYLLENSLVHSLLQLFLFIVLFLIISKVYLHYSNRKINKLIPEELMMILRHINNSRIKGMMINQTKMRELLKITKPTLKKRLDALLETGYISFEQVGNHRYLKLTTLGESVLN